MWDNRAPRHLTSEEAATVMTNSAPCFFFFFFLLLSQNAHNSSLRWDEAKSKGGLVRAWYPGWPFVVF